MAETRIEWTDVRFSAWAVRIVMQLEMAKRLEAMGVEKYKTASRTIWSVLVCEDRKALLLPYRGWKPRKIFANSMSDLFGVVSGNPTKFCNVCHLLLFWNWITKKGDNCSRKQFDF